MKIKIRCKIDFCCVGGDRCPGIAQVIIAIDCWLSDRMKYKFYGFVERSCKETKEPTSLLQSSFWSLSLWSEVRCARLRIRVMRTLYWSVDKSVEAAVVTRQCSIFFSAFVNRLDYRRRSARGLFHCCVVVEYICQCKIGSAD